MFNLFISAQVGSWEEGSYEYSRDRIIKEYTAQEIVERYRELDEINVEELKSFPCIFVVEGEDEPSRIGYLTNIRLRSNTCLIEFELDNAFQPLPEGTIEDLRTEIDLGRWELSRTHWAVKDEPILDILLKKGVISQDEIDRSHFSELPESPVNQPVPNGSGAEFNTAQVFIVHGHDEIAKLEMEEFLKSLGLEPIILSKQPSSGRTIIEKIEHYTNVGFGVVLYTECDIGYKKGTMVQKYRARQNVIFEHGFLIGKLGRERVVALVKGDIETPNDISGVVYVQWDEKEGWKSELINEMRELGYEV